MRHILENVAFGRSNIVLNLRVGTEEVPAEVAGVWAVHKGINKGSKWVITHIPSSMVLHSFGSAKDAKDFIVAMVEKEPSLLNVPNAEDVGKHVEMLKAMIMANIKGKRPAGQLDDDEIRKILADEGLSKGASRSGKAGEMWGVPGVSRQVAIGRRDIMLNYFFVEIESYRDSDSAKPGSRWNNYRIEYKSKMTEETLRKWAKWAKNGLTTKAVTGIAREEFQSYKRKENDHEGFRRGTADGLGNTAKPVGEGFGMRKLINQLKDISEGTWQKLLTAKDKKNLPPLYSQENEKDPMVWVKLFDPMGQGTWFMLEFDGKDTFFCYVMGLGGDELGYSSLSELSQVIPRPFPHKIERDQWFKPKKLSQAKAEMNRASGRSEE